MLHPKPGPREHCRQLQKERVARSASLADKFPQLKSLTVEFEYLTREGFARNRQIKYSVNPRFAKSVFRLDCLNHTCVCGDFDLSKALSAALAARRATLEGELRCNGWIDQESIKTVRCRLILRYKLILRYGTARGGFKARVSAGVS